MALGWIYIMSNPSLSEIKIGESSKDPSGDRVKDLSNTSVPTPFKVEYKALVDGQQNVEVKIHKALAKFRVNPNREFFNCSVMDAVLLIRKKITIEKEYMYYNEKKWLKDQQKEKAAGKKHKEIGRYIFRCGAEEMRGATFVIDYPEVRAKRGKNS
ncbi:GIY-YIG nuclease family protein [Pseudomonadales bacterium]|nr:GIY-YIG nuclease family protein [Pseudomonadales bacterium]